MITQIFFSQINRKRSKKVGSNLNTIDMLRVSVIPNQCKRIKSIVIVGCVSSEKKNVTAFHNSMLLLIDTEHFRFTLL